VALELRKSECKKCAERGIEENVKFRYQSERVKKRNKNTSNWLESLPVDKEAKQDQEEVHFAMFSIVIGTYSLTSSTYSCDLERW